LGNVRQTFNRSASPGVLHYASYYPFGLSMAAGGDGYRYGYQGLSRPLCGREYAEDETEETGWNAFELRMYDPVIGRWISTDPYKQFYSPYLGMGNNPKNTFDPDGGTCYDANGYAISCPDGFSQYSDPGNDMSFLNDVEVQGNAWTKAEEIAFRKLMQISTFDLASAPGRHLYLNESFIHNVKEGVPAAFELWRELNGLSGSEVDLEDGMQGGAPFTPGLKKFPFKTTKHFRNRLVQRGSRGITTVLAIEAYNKGRLYYNPNTGNYIRHLSRHKISVAVTQPSGGTAITVFEGKPSPDWLPIKWRPN
jgi:RHS repeat-associated protein